jgi:hypothetical protein
MCNVLGVSLPIKSSYAPSAFAPTIKMSVTRTPVGRTLWDFVSVVLPRQSQRGDMSAATSEHTHSTEI